MGTLVTICCIIMTVFVVLTNKRVAKIQKELKEFCDSMK